MPAEQLKVAGGGVSDMPAHPRGEHKGRGRRGPGAGAGRRREEHGRPQPARHRPRAAASSASLPDAVRRAALTHLRTWRASRRAEGKRLRDL